MRSDKRKGWLKGWIAAGIFSCAAAVTACGAAETNNTVQAESQAALEESGEASQEGAESSAKAEKTEEMSAETSQVESQRMTAPLPEFEQTEDEIYVKTTDGTSVRIRSACDTGDDSNILTYASTGTKLKRTGKGSQWTRIDYNGMSGYIATEYITTEVPATTAPAKTSAEGGQITMDSSWKYAEFSKISSGAATLYRSEAENRKDITVCVNAGHGTKGGSAVKTLCHPDGTPKVTGGTTGAGAVSAAAVSGGMTFADGTEEHRVTLSMALILKDKLLAKGYDVVMIRESEDVQLDNVARTVIANNTSDCHISLHWDSTTSDKGVFYMSVPDVASYRNMEPVKSHWKEHNALGESLVAGLKAGGAKVFSGGAMAMDLTQTSYSTIPSVDIELGDKASDHSKATLGSLADGLAAGLDLYFEQ